MKAREFAKEVHLILSLPEFYCLGSILDEQLPDEGEKEMFDGIYEKMLELKRRLDTELGVDE